MKTQLKRLSAIFGALSISAMLSACGGGGGGNSGGSDTPVVTPVIPVVFDIEEEFEEYLTGLADGYIIPSYENMLTEASSLQSATSNFCGLSNPSTNELESLQEQWLSLNLAWQAIQWLKVGEVVSDNRLFRLQFFPDVNDAVTRGVDDLLIEPELNADLIATQNVGAQGLPALELLLYSEIDGQSLLNANNFAKRCEAIQAISDNVVNISSEIYDAWRADAGNYREQLITGTGDFTSIQDSVEELVTNWLEHTEIVKDEKMIFPLADEIPGEIELSEFWRSNSSLISIQSNLQAIKSIYTNNDNKGFDTILSDGLELSDVSDEMTDAIDAAIESFAEVSNNFDTLEDAINDAEGRTQLSAAIDELRDVRDILTTGFIQALDISIGFNSLDGD